MHFNNVLVFDLATNEWSDPDIDTNGVPRWNHSGILVEAIPNWIYFVFGGECAEYQEGTLRTFGQYVNSSCYFNLGTKKWTEYASNPDTFSNIPSPREYSAVAFDTNNLNSLIVFGGWNNGWFGDLYSLAVGKIVGPPYAITGSDPCLGQLSGKTELRIFG